MSGSSNIKPRLFGKVTASVTHELQNVLAIIKENAGLMDDLLTLTSSHDAEHLAQRLSRSLATIKKQVQRGVDLTSNLNGFAHTADHDFRSIDVLEVSQRLLDLTGRMARNAGISIRIEEPGQPVQLDTDPVQIQVCLFLAMESLLSALPAGTAVVITILGSKPVTGIDFTFSEENTQPEKAADTIKQSRAWFELQESLPLINATCNTGSGTVHLRFP